MIQAEAPWRPNFIFQLGPYRPGDIITTHVLPSLFSSTDLCSQGCVWSTEFHFPSGNWKTSSDSFFAAGGNWCGEEGEGRILQFGPFPAIDQTLFYPTHRRVLYHNGRLPQIHVLSVAVFPARLYYYQFCRPFCGRNYPSLQTLAFAGQWS